MMHHVSLAVVLLFVISSAQGVHMSPNNQGQVLIYPFYTVEGGHDTYISVVNTSADYKAIFVRINEAQSSVETLGFHIYLRPRDHWSAVITKSEKGATITTADKSCTLPMFGAAPVDFHTFDYNRSKPSNVKADRTRKGFLTIIEAGVVDPKYKNLFEKRSVDFSFDDCSGLREAWSSGGVFETQLAGVLTRPTGGLYGYGVVINVEEGTNATYSAIALDEFSNKSIHGLGYYDSISLKDANPPVATILTASGPKTLSFKTGIEAVSAVLMKATISNDVVLEESINAETSWVVTFPTKTYHVNEIGASKPFSVPRDLATSTACHFFGINYHERDNQYYSDFGTGPLLNFCDDANILNFRDSRVLGSSSRVDTNFDQGGNGWAEIFLNVVHGAPIPGYYNSPFKVDASIGLDPINGATNIQGLPVVGFAIQKYVNGSVGGVLANYVGLLPHRGTVIVTP